LLPAFHRTTWDSSSAPGREQGLLPAGTNGYHSLPAPMPAQPMPTLDDLLCTPRKAPPTLAMYKASVRAPGKRLPRLEGPQRIPHTAR
jgi:hypothetical protein